MGVGGGGRGPLTSYSSREIPACSIPEADHRPACMPSEEESEDGARDHHPAKTVKALLSGCLGNGTSQ